MYNKNLLNTFFLLLMDTLTLITLFYFSTFLREQFHFNSIPVFKTIRIHDFIFVVVVILFLFYSEKIYTFRYDFWQETKKIIKSLFLGYLLTLTLLALMKTNQEYSRLFLTIYFLLAILIFPVLRRFIKKLLYSFSALQKKVCIIGNETDKEKITQEFAENFYLGQTVNCSYDYDSVIIISKGMTTDNLNKLIETHIDTCDGLYLIPYVDKINFSHSTIIEYSNIRSNSIFIQDRLLLKRNVFIKNSFDYLLALLLLPFVMVVHLFLIIAIKHDSPGKVFFKQVRLGKENQNFICYKYRTMYENGDHLLTDYLEKHPHEVDYYQQYHKYQNDPRITKVGKFLRATSLDELPQIINVLKGEMSFVGPRPYMINEQNKLGSKQKFILKVKPGITGLWQVNGRNNLTFEERKALEVWYIKNWLLSDDFIILIKTIKVVLMKVGAK